MKKYFLISVLPALLLALALLQPGCKGEGPAPEPNIVLIVLDTMRADNWPVYGYHKNTTPFLSQLAKEAVVFDNAFAASSWTAPATSSIFTSMYPFQHGVVNGYFASKGFKLKLNKIPGKIKTITEVLKENGYYTFGVADNVNITKALGFEQGFDYFKNFPYKLESHMDRRLWASMKEVTVNKKYFLYIHYNDTHAPLHQRKPWYEKKKGYKENTFSLYDSEINYVDAKIKKMYDRYGWDKNTIIIVVADHGEELWDHGKVGHGYHLYTEQTRVPFFIRFPPGVRADAKPGVRADAMRIKTNVSSLDILPTIRSFLRLKRTQPESGVNLMPLINGEKGADEPRYIFSHLILRYRDAKDKKKMHAATFKSIVYDKWHYIFRFDENSGNVFKRLLFDRERDPKELNNLYDGNKKIAGKMLSKLSLFEKKCKKYTSKSKEMELSKEKVEELKSLGYVK